MSTNLLTILLLCAGLIFAGQTGAQNPTSTAPTPTATGPRYTFVEAESPVVSPCLTCVSFATSKRYKSGNISWSTCSSGNTSKKFYLNFRMTKGSSDLRVRLLRDCSNPSRIQVIRCPGSGAGELNWAAYSNSVAFASGPGLQILLVNIESDGVVKIELKAGWTLHYDRQTCPE